MPGLGWPPSRASPLVLLLLLLLSGWALAWQPPPRPTAGCGPPWRFQRAPRYLFSNGSYAVDGASLCPAFAPLRRHSPLAQALPNATACVFDRSRPCRFSLRAQYLEPRPPPCQAMLRLRNVYYSGWGVTTTRDARGRPVGIIPDVYPAGKVDRLLRGPLPLAECYPVALGLGVAWAFNLYHIVFDALPTLLRVQAFLARNPHVPVLIGRPLVLPERLLFMLTGLRLQRFRQIHAPFPEGEPSAAFVEKLYVPGYTTRRDTQLLAGAIRRNIVPHAGRSALYPARHAPFIVVYRRARNRRGFPARILLQHKELVTLLRTVYPPESVVEFDGVTDENLLDTTFLLQHAAAFIGPHGAGFIAILLARPGALTVVELRPREHDRDCFERVSAEMNFTYHKYLTGGTQISPLTLNFRHFFARLLTLLPKPRR